jgi:twitching motility protein PilT
LRVSSVVFRFSRLKWAFFPFALDRTPFWSLKLQRTGGVMAFLRRVAHVSDKEEIMQAESDFKVIFTRAVQEGASDMFIKVGQQPALRVAGKVKLLDGPSVTPEVAKAIFDGITDDRAKRIFDDVGEVDTAYEILGAGRFRANIFRQRNQLGFVLRIVQTKIPSLDDLKLPVQQLKKLAIASRGLGLITGTAGSGKSTTLAAMLDHVNSNMNKHIITVEDPIEFLLTDKKCIIEQRELGIDTQSFVLALKHIVRQSPDVIMIGEMRDTETVEAALAGAETGHLVFSTLHTVNAMQTVERIMNFFPTHQHQFVRQQLALLLEGVVSMRLIPTKDGLSRVPAVEIMMSTPTVRELLHEGKTREIYKALKEGGYFGCQTFNQSLKGLIAADLITLDDAFAAADSPDELKLEIRGIMKGTKADFDFKL